MPRRILTVALLSFVLAGSCAARQIAVVVGKTGRGTYVYTGLSFFRQLPAGVAGAFRIFANLLALR